MKTLAFFAVFVLSAVNAWAQNPCTATKPPLTIVTSTSNVTATMADYNTMFNGQFVISDLDILVVPAGADPATATPVLTRNTARSAWTLVPGTSDCYQTPAPFLVTVTPNTTFDLWVRSNGPAGQKGPWQGGSGAVPFGFPSAPAARTGVRATP